MKPANKLLMRLQKEVLRFDCKDCNRNWAFEDY
jgi:transposase-like protein